MPEVYSFPLYPLYNSYPHHPIYMRTARMYITSVTTPNPHTMNPFEPLIIFAGLFVLISL